MEFGMRQGADVSKEFSTTKLTCLLGELLLLSLFPSLLGVVEAPEWLQE